VAIALELQLHLGDVGIGAVAEALLQLAHDRGVDVLVVAGDPADVEHHRDRIDLLAQAGVGVL
jgi:hypothetical protein